LGIVTLGASLLAGGTCDENPYLGPEQLIQWSGDNLVAQFPSDWLRLRGPVGTVCITGDDRIGKSTLLTLWGRSLLRNRNDSFSFSVDHKRTSHTQGLWSAIILSNASGLPYHLNLCDSQGLKQTSGLKETRLFSANVFIPDVLVYMLYSVIQNDQVRDLARMAIQFKTLSKNALHAFSNDAAPHLLVVVRDESDLAEEDETSSLTAHLEEVLASPDYAEDKALIRSVFQTRQAMSLRRLPSEALRALRQGRTPLNAAAAPWSASGNAILERVRMELDVRAFSLPLDGRELASWYSSVVETVNDEDSISFSRLIGHEQRLSSGRFKVRMLDEWGGLVLFILAGLGVVLYVGGIVGRWLDCVAWAAWIVSWALSLGASPLVTEQLRGVVPTFCDRALGLEGSLAAVLCKEASPRTAALLLATFMGIVSYPMLTAQFHRWAQSLTESLPFVNDHLRRWVVVLALAGVVAILQVSREVVWGSVTTPQGTINLSLLIRVALAASSIYNVLAFCRKVHINNLLLSASSVGRAAHAYVALRILEVHELESSWEWRAHYRRHKKQDAFWRFRTSSTWFQAAACLQSFGFLGWGLLIRPHVDLLLAIGTAVNILRCMVQSALALLPVVCRYRRSIVSDEAFVVQWLEQNGGYEDAEFCHLTGIEFTGVAYPIIEESDEELSARHSIESMRVEQEKLGLRLRH